MYAGRVACCPLVSHGEYADGTDRRTDARQLRYAFRYGRSPRNKVMGGCMKQMEAGTWYCLLDDSTGRRKHMYAAHVWSGLAVAEECSHKLDEQRSSVDIPSINSSLQPAFSIRVRFHRI